MTRPLSIDLRKRLISAVEDGMSRRSAAARFGRRVDGDQMGRSVAADERCAAAAAGRG